VRGPPVHRPGHQLRADDPGRDAPGHDERQRACTPLRCHAVGCRETERQHHGGVAPAEEGREAEQPEPSQDDGEHGQQAGQYAGSRPCQKGGTPAMAPGNRTHRKDARRHAHHEDGNRQGCQYGRRGQHISDNGARGVDNHRVGTGQRLCDGKPPDVSALDIFREYAGSIGGYGVAVVHMIKFEYVGVDDAASALKNESRSRVESRILACWARTSKRDRCQSVQNGRHDALDGGIYRPRADSTY